MSDDKELWIDLHTLVPSATLDSGFLYIHYQYRKEYPKPDPDPIIYNLRTALRALGFKITQIIKIIESNGFIRMMTIRTDIPSNLFEKTMPIYNDSWVDAVIVDEYDDSDSKDEKQAVKHHDKVAKELGYDSIGHMYGV